MTTDTELMERAWDVLREAARHARPSDYDWDVDFSREVAATIAALRSRLDAPAQECDYPECSGDPRSCPENEGYGCCSAPAPAAVVDERAELPPLPSTDYSLCFYDEGGIQEASGDGFTAEHMYAYARADRAAKGG